jgi:chemotaxis protein CheX
MTSSGHASATANTHQNWIPLLEMATREVFELMLSCQLTPASTVDESGMDVTSMVGLAGELCGVITVRCHHKAAVLMASKMLGLPIEKVGQDFSDAIGEVCNMVAGNFKNKIAGLSDGCMLSPPSVITGSDYSLHSLADSPGLQVRTLFENLPIVITLQIHS